MKSKDIILCIMGNDCKACLYDETVVAEANGVIEDPGQGWTSKVAQSEGGSEQTGHKALNLKKSQSIESKKILERLLPRTRGTRVSPQDCLSSPFQVQPKNMVSA